MFPILAEMRIVQFFRAFYYLVGPLGVIIGFALGAAVLFLAFFRSGARYLFYVFLLQSLLVSVAPEGGKASMISLTVFRYFLLFPLTFWGIIWLFSKDRRFGWVGKLLFLHVLLYVPSLVFNSWRGWERWIATSMIWFALIGTISGQITDIEKLKRFLSEIGVGSWFVVLFLGGYAVLFPGLSFESGRLHSYLFRPNALAISLFFVIIAMGYRAFIMSPNKFRMIDVAATGVALMMMIMTGTRAAGFGIIPVLFVLLRGRSKSYILLSALVFLVVFGIAWNIPSLNIVIQDRFLGTTAPLTTSRRIELWRADWPIVFEKPLTGFGMGYSAEAGLRPHNSFLSIAIEGGIFNALVFTLIFIVSLFGGYLNLLHLQSGPDRRIGWLILSSILGVAFICFFEGIGSGIGGGGMAVIWTFVQLAISLRPQQEQELYYLDSIEEDYSYYPVETGEFTPSP